MYKCQVCGNVEARMYVVCPECRTRNSYLPTSETVSSSGNFTQKEWDDKVNKPKR